MKSFLKFFTIILFVSFFVGCATTGKAPKKVKYNEKKFNAAYEEGDYKTCVAMIKNRNKKADNILYMLDAAILEHMDENFSDSQDDLNDTVRAIDDAFTKSVSREAGAAVFNDNISEYSGNIYEYLFVNAFNALNYYNQDNLEEALVEIRQLDVKNREYVSKYGEVALMAGDENLSAKVENDENISDTSSALEMVGVDKSEILSQAPKKPTEADVYRDSAFVRYLAFMMRSMYDDVNNEVDGKFLSALNPDFSSTVENVMNIPYGKGRLDVLSLAGKIANRQEGEVVFPLALLSGLAPMLLMNVIYTGGSIDLFNLHFKFPVFVPEKVVVYPEKIFAVNEETGERDEINFMVLENFDEAVRKDVAVVGRKAYLRSVTRSTIKKVSAIVAGETALQVANREANRDDDNMAAAIAALAVNIAAKTARFGLEALDKSEKPDLRQCSYFPKVAFAGGVSLKPGKYTVTVEYNNGKKDVFEEVEVKAGKIKMLESICIK